MELFLSENPVYQNLLNSEVNFQEHQGDLKRNFLAKINPDHIDLYLYLNHHSDQKPKIPEERLQTYPEFLDKYQYPEDDFLLFYLTYPDIRHEKLMKIRQEFSKMRGLKFLKHLCQTSTLYLKVFKFSADHNNQVHKLTNIRHLPILKYLKERYIELDNDEILINGAKYGYLEIVKYLLEPSPAKPEIVDIHIDDDEVLKLSCEYGHLEIVKYLLELSPEIANIHAGHDEPLRLSVAAGHLKIVKYLLEPSSAKPEIANIHALDDEALRFSADNGHLEMVKLLLEYGANVRARNDEALRMSYANGHSEVVKLLQKYGANL